MSSRIQRTVEFLAWTVGIGLLVAYASQRMSTAYASNEAVESLREARVERTNLASLSPPVRASMPLQRKPDTATWSAKRIAGYESAMRDRALPEGVLRIPRFGLEIPLYDGTSDRTLDRGGGLIEGTASVDSATGNIGIAAHRDGFFRPLKDIKVGDEMFLDTLSDTKRYRVAHIRIVDPSDVSVLESTATPTITLVTCYPFYFVGSAPQRFIVQALSAER